MTNVSYCYSSVHDMCLLLRWQNVSYDDEDVYHCLASNKFGSAGFSSSLVVRSKFIHWSLVTGSVTTVVVCPLKSVK